MKLDDGAGPSAKPVFLDLLDRILHFFNFCRIIEQHRVNALFTIPTAFRVLKRVDPSAKYARRYCGNSLKTVFIAGEHCDQDTRVSEQCNCRIF